MENQTVVTLRQGEGRYFASGGLWIYDNEISTIQGRFKNGSVVTVQDAAGRALGKGFINQNSKIRLRMLTRNPEQEIDEAFLRFRVRGAWEYRKTVLRAVQPAPVSPEAEKILRNWTGKMIFMSCFWQAWNNCRMLSFGIGKNRGVSAEFIKEI